MARLSLSFLGPPRIEIDGQSVGLDTRKAIALLAYLAVTDEAVSRDAAVTLLWAKYGRSQGQAALRRTLSTLRREMKADWLSIEREKIGLCRTADVWVDVARMRELLAQSAGHRHGTLGVCRGCLVPLNEAARLFRGDFLLGFTLKDSLAFDDWQFFLTEDFRLQHASTLDRLALCLAAAGDHENALACARRRLELDPLDESAHQRLMQHYAWAGNRSAALRQFEECTALLRREMESLPGEEIGFLAESIRRGHTPDLPAFDDVPVENAPAPTALRRATDRSSPVAGGSESAFRPLRQEPAETEGAEATVVVARPARRSDPPAEVEKAFPRLFAEGIAKYRGRILHASGIEEIASFSDRILTESNPELAVRAALEIAEGAASAGFAAKIGIATGPAFGLSASEGSSEQPRPSGRAVLLATLLAERSAPGEPLISESTYRLTREVFSFGEPPAQEVSATLQPTVYSVRGLAPLSRKTRGIEGTRPPLVGREEELQKLIAAYEKSADGRGQVVIVTGEAGIGKSRLIAELHDCAANALADPKPLWLEGRCLAPTIAVGYWPIVDALRALVTQRGPLEQILAGMARDGRLEDEEASKMAAVLSGLAKMSPGDAPGGHEVQPRQMKERIFAAIQSLFRAIASVAPLVLVFEDLHWADELSLELIEALMVFLRGSPALLACVYRNDPVHKSLHLAAAAARRRPGELLEIRLREMTSEESERMLDALLPDATLSASRRRQILDRCQGNPYFLEEVVRALSGESAAQVSLEAGTGDLPPSRPATGGSAAGALAAGPCPEGAGRAVPEGVKAVVLGRYHALTTPQRETLACAAVIGRVFRKRLLELAMSSGDLTSVLDELEDRELLFVERTLPEIEYSFKHVLAQEAVYEDMTQSVREELHRHVARAYEQKSAGAPEEYCEELARHYDLGGVAEKAIEQYFRSGVKAGGLYANEAAVSHLSRGLELLRSDFRAPDARPSEIDFLIALGVPLVLIRGHFSAEVENLYLRAREIGRESATPDQLFQVTLGLHRLYFSRGEHRKTSEVDEEMIEIGRRLHDPILTSRAHMMLAETLFTMGDFPGVLLHAESGSDLYQPGEHRTHLLKFGNDTGVGALLLKAEAEWGLGFPDRALKTVSSAVDRSREISHPFTMVFALYMASFVAFMRREPERAVTWAEECTEVARRERFPLYMGFGPVVQGWALGMLGEVDRGVQSVREALSILPPGLPFRIAYAAMLAELHWKAGRFEEALASLDTGFEVVRNSDAHLWEPELNRLRADIGLDAGEPEVDAERWLQRALKTARHQASPSLQLRAAIALYRLKQRGGRPDADRARERLAAIYRDFTEGFETADLVDARRVMDEAGDAP